MQRKERQQEKLAKKLERKKNPDWDRPEASDENPEGDRPEGSEETPGVDPEPRDS